MSGSPAEVWVVFTCASQALAYEHRDTAKYTVDHCPNRDKEKFCFMAQYRKVRRRARKAAKK